ncbi:MAG: rhomboid family intramembrane serine protease [Longimicrobiales bacterium]
MGMTPWVLRLIVANITVFFITYAVPGIWQLLMLVPAAVLSRPWTIFTYMFVHAGFGHLFFNMIGLYFFGPQLELQLGRRRFIRLYILSGLGGAVLSFLFAPGAAVVGASGAVFGVFLGFARFWPDAPIYIWFLFPVKAKWLVGFMAALSLFSGISGAGTAIAHFAHLGGFVAGWIYLRFIERADARRRLGGAAGPTTLERVSGQLAREEKRWRSIDTTRLHEVNRAEVDRVLAKIAQGGVDSLTRDEREFMNRMAG